MTNNEFQQLKIGDLVYYDKFPKAILQIKSFTTGSYVFVKEIYDSNIVETGKTILYSYKILYKINI